jgi:adenylate cyclase
MTLPEEIVGENLGNHAVRGRGQGLDVVALSSRAVTVLNQPATLRRG